MAVVDKVVDERGTRAVAEAYLEYLYSPEGQETRREALLPAARPRARRPGRRERFPEVELVTIDEVFGGWQKAQSRHFADGGVFDQIYARPHAEGQSAVTRRCASSSRASLPGFGLTLGFTLTYLGLIVLIPLRRSGRAVPPAEPARSSWRSLASTRASLAAFRLSFGTALRRRG